jgi:hypothetical protein
MAQTNGTHTNGNGTDKFTPNENPYAPKYQDPLSRVNNFYIIESTLRGN